MPDDYGLPSKVWKKVKALNDRRFPKHKQEERKQQERINEFRSSSRVNDIIYSTTFKFVPSEQIMTMLIIHSIYQ